MNIPEFQQKNGTYILSIPQGMQLREPVTFSVPNNADVQIEAGSDSQAAVSLILEGGATMDISVHDDASLSVISLHTCSGTVRQRSNVERGATVHFQNISLGEEIDHQLHSHINGAHAESNIDWMFYAKNKERHTITAHNIFNASDGGGEIVMKGVAEDNAHVVCDGMINIGLRGGGTDTYLTEDVLMLDTSAKVDAVPGLEIKTNDVKASHSATVSKVTPEDLFYFAARGIDEESARHMYIEGFLGDRTANIIDSSAKESIQSSIAQKLIR